MPVTPNDPGAHDEQDAPAVEASLRLGDTPDDAALTVFQTVEWVPPAYRQAYLDGAASVLGTEPLVES